MRVASPGRASQPRRRLADGPSTYRAVSLAQLARQLGASEQGAFKPCAKRLRDMALRARLRGSEIAVLRERYRKARYPPGAGERDVELMSAASITRNGGASDDGAFKPCAAILSELAQRARHMGSELAQMRGRKRRSPRPSCAREAAVGAAYIARDSGRPPASSPLRQQRAAPDFMPRRALLPKLRARIGTGGDAAISRRDPRQSLPGSPESRRHTAHRAMIATANDNERLFSDVI